jgi:transcriptional/translational regulatory protein YebC/TACO1
VTKEEAEVMISLVDVLENLDDVSQVFNNVEISEDLLN